MYRLDPSKILRDPINGREKAMVEFFLLHACQTGGAQLKFANIGEKLRIAIVVDGTLYEYPQPPDCVQRPTMDQLRQIFSTTTGESESECELQLENTTARMKLEFDSEKGAVVTIIRSFDDLSTVSNMINRFWRAHAASQGTIALARYYTREAIRTVYNTAHKAIVPSRKNALT